MNAILQIPTGGPVFAHINNLPLSTSVGFSGLFGAGSPYFQTATATYYVTFTGTYSLVVNATINGTQSGLVTNAYLDYSYMRIA